jgi:hypothetical protein
MDINVLPQLCVHLIKEYLQDRIDEERNKLRADYISTRLLEMYKKQKDFIKTNNLSKPKIATLRRAVALALSSTSFYDNSDCWKPKTGCYYLCNTRDKIEEEVLKHIGRRKNMIKLASATGNPHEPEVYKCYYAGACLLESACEFLQRKKKKSRA